jgi:putative intracellular protease/amidase
LLLLIGLNSRGCRLPRKWPQRRVFFGDVTPGGRPRLVPMRALFATALVLLAPGKSVEQKRQVETMRVLMVVSAATELPLADGAPMTVGYWAAEVEVPLTRLREAGYVVDVVTPGGKTPVPDAVSLPKDPARAKAVREAHAELEGVAKPGSLEALDEAALAKYAAIVIPGGYAPMVDLASSPAMGAALAGAMKRNAIVAAICHGPAAFLSAKPANGAWPFAGYRMSPFTNAEEAAWLKEKRLPWYVETSLRDAGADVETAGNWESKVTRDRNVITGQSSPSVDAFTDALLAALAERRK